MYPPFTPIPGAGKSISSSTTTASVDLGALGPQVSVCNSSDTVIFIEFGGASVEATSADFAVAPGERLTLTRPDGQTYVAALAAASTGKVIYFAPGHGS